MSDSFYGPITNKVVPDRYTGVVQDDGSVSGGTAAVADANSPRKHPGVVTIQKPKEVKEVKEQFSAFSGSGIDTTTLEADLQGKYGALAQSSGRRGSQARAILMKQGDKAVRDFMSSESYEKLLADPSSIRDTSMQTALQTAIGDEWKDFASGQKGDQGTINYESLDTSSLESFLKIKGTPFSFLRDAYEANQEGGTKEASTAAASTGSLIADIDSIQTTPDALPTLSGTTQNTSNYNQGEVKRI